MSTYTVFSMSDGDSSKHYIIDSHSDRSGQAKLFKSLEEAYIFAEQHCYAYRVNVDGIPYSVEKGIALIKELKKAGMINY